MRIGIDVDDVITNTSESAKNYIEKNDNNGDLKNYMEDIMRGDMTTPKIKEFFAENSCKIFKEASVKPNASKIIKKWLDAGNEVFIITSRGEIKFKDSERITLDCFKLNDIKYTKILFNSFEKAKICEENKIDVLIDDSAKYCEEVASKNIESILFNSVVNKNITVNVPRVEDWLELEEKVKEIFN